MTTHYERHWPRFARHMPAVGHLFRALEKDLSGPALYREAVEMVMNGNVVLHTDDGLFRINTHEARSAVFFEITRRILEESEFSMGIMLDAPGFNKYASWLIKRMKAEPDGVYLTLQQHYQMLSHARAGHQVYAVSPGLAAELRYTELRGLTPADLHLPYESIYIEVPPEAEIRIYDSATDWHRIEGIYITEDNWDLDTKDGRPARLVDRDTEFAAMPRRGWRLMVVGECKGGDIDNDALFYFYLPLGKESLDDCMEAEEERLKKGWAEVGMEGSDADWKNLEVWRDIFRWAMNVVVYATNVDAGERYMGNREAAKLQERIQKLPAQSKKRQGLLQKLKGMDARPRYLLGREVVVVKRAPGQETAEPGTGTSRGALKVRTRVAGHWRRVAHGPGRTERRWTRIAPFWRGPEDGVFSAPKHELR